MTLSFLLTSLIVVASPGTGVLYTLAVALTSGARPGIAAAFGCTLGIVPHMLAAMLGLAAVLHTSALAFAALKWCGVAYLLYMAWQALRETGIATIFTALTLSVGVATWSFSELKFQADMGLLLTFMFMVNMLMAMTLLPALAVTIDMLIPRRRPVRAPFLTH